MTRQMRQALRRNYSLLHAGLLFMAELTLAANELKTEF